MSQGRDAHVPWGDAYVPEGCGCPREGMQVSQGDAHVLGVGCRCPGEGMHMCQGGCLCPGGMQVSQGRDADVPWGHAYVLAGCRCPMGGCRCPGDGMQMSRGGDACVPGGTHILHEGDACVLGVHMSRGGGCKPWGGGCTCPGGLRGRRQGAGSQRVRAVPHGLCTGCDPPLAAPQPAAGGLPLTPHAAPEWGLCPTALRTMALPSPHGGVPGLHPPLGGMSNTRGEHVCSHYPPSCEMPPLQRC